MFLKNITQALRIRAVLYTIDGNLEFQWRENGIYFENLRLWSQPKRGFKKYNRS